MRVPYAFSRIICMCDHPKYGLKHVHECETKDCHISICQRCKKMMPFDLAKCLDCGAWYHRKEYRSNKSCLRRPRCLTCISLVRTPCTEHENCYWAYYDRPDLQVIHTFELHTMGDIDNTLDALLDSEPVNFFD